MVGVLAEHAETLGEPYTRHLNGKVRELRFHLLRQQTRVTYWLAPRRRVVLLTVFRKTRSAETAKCSAPCRRRRPAKPSTASRTTATNAREVEMSTEHRSYKQTARRRRGSAEFREGYEEAHRAFLIGQAVRERRHALGLSQTEVAARAGMTQPALSRLEAGGAVPTIAVLERIAAALGAELLVTIAPPAA